MLKRKHLKKKTHLFDDFDAKDSSVASLPDLNQSSSTEKLSDSPSFFKEFEKSLEEKEFKVGEIVRGQILSFNEDYVVVDINYKSEGLIPISEFRSSKRTKKEGEGQDSAGSEKNFSSSYGVSAEKKGREEEGFASKRFESKRNRSKKKFRKKTDKEDLFLRKRRLSASEREELLNKIQVGSEVEVYIENIENESGRVVLSKDKADALKIWDHVSRAAETGEPIEGYVEAKVKGGLSIDMGMKAFLPGSQVDIRPVVDMDQFVGKTYKFKVIKFNKKRGNVVLSRRALLEEERESLRVQTLTNIKEGSIVKGVVKGITEYGVFIDLGGMDGLLHITDMSWKRIKHPSEVLKEHQELDVMILKYDSEKNRVNLGLKQIKENPWTKVEENYPIGSRVKGKIMTVTDYGAFVELSEGVEGLIHISEMSWIKRLKHPSQVVKGGQEVEVKILEIDTKSHRISLGLKQLQPNPWEELKKKYPINSVIEGEVRSVTDFGIFVGINEEIDGLVHISDFSWTRRINSPSNEFEKGDKVRAVVLGIDTKAERFSLGIKQLEANPWSDVHLRYPIGSRHSVKVIESTDFGVFVELEQGVEGLIHISELSTKRIEKTSDVVNIGESIEAEIINIDTKARKIGLSVKVIKLREQQGMSVKMEKEKEPSPDDSPQVLSPSPETKEIKTENDFDASLEKPFEEKPKDPI